MFHLFRRSQPKRIRHNARANRRLICEGLERRELMATDLYVSNTGNDTTGSGTIAAPYATLAKAISLTQAGDSVVLRGGEYAGGVSISAPNVTIRSHTNEWAVIRTGTTATSPDWSVRFRPTANGGKLQRVEVVGGGFYGVKIDSEWSSVPSERVAATGVVIEDSRIHDTGRDAIKITPGCDDVIIRRNEIFNTGVRDPSNAEGIDNVNGDRMHVVENYIYNTATTGVYAKGGAINTVIERNLIKNTGNGGVFLGFADTDAEFFDTVVNPQYYENIGGVVRNNMIIGSVGPGIGLFGTKDAIIVNNTLIDVAAQSRSGIHLESSETWVSDFEPLLVPNVGSTIVNNIVTLPNASTRLAVEIREDGLSGAVRMAANRYHHIGKTPTFLDQRVGNEYSGGLTGWTAHVASETGSSQGDPQLNTSYHLLATSPLINTGSSLVTVTIDYDGTARTGLLDIGADEAGGPALPVPPPVGTIGIGKVAGVAVGFSLATSNGLESVASPQIAVTLSSVSTTTVSVAYSIGNGTATAADHTLRTGSLVFAPGQRTLNIPLNIVNDLLDENNETILVSLTGALGASLGITQHTYTILDDDVMPTVQFSSTSRTVFEDAPAQSIEVTLSAPSGRSITVDYQVLSGTATSGLDYRVTAGRLTFAAGQTRQVITLTPVNDTLDENDEHIILGLRSPVNATLGAQSSYRVNLRDNDLPPLISFSTQSTSINENSGVSTLTFRLNKASGLTAMLTYSVTAQTATGGGVDYTANNGMVMFAPGQTTKTITIPIVNDALVEANETFRLTLTSASNGTLSLNRAHTVTIVDDDAVPTTSAAMVYRLADGHIYKIAPTAGATPVDLTLALNRMSAGSNDDSVNISPDGKWLALVTDRFSIGASWTGLAVVASDMSRGGAVIVDSQFVHPEGAVAIASGGNVVVYSGSGGPHVRDLWAATRMTNGEWSLRLLTAASPFQYNSQPAISADGTRLLFDGGNQPYDTGSQAICEVMIDGTGFRQVVTNAMRPIGAPLDSNIHHADYAPDGSIVFEAGWTGEQLWRLRAGTTVPERVSDANNDNSPCVLSDGRIVSLWLNRVGNPNGFHELTVRRADGTYELTLLPGVDVQDIGLSCGG